MAFREPCPVCGHFVEGKRKGIFSKRLILPSYCGGCGATMHVNCTTCGRGLLHLSRFCPHCRTELYPGAAAASQSGGVPQQATIPPGQAQLLRKLEDDVADLCLFGPEMFRIVIRTNPVNLQIHQFNATLHEMPEDTSREHMAEIIGAAVAQADLSNALAELDEFDAAIREFGGSVMSELDKDLRAVIPDHRQKMPDLADCHDLSRHHSEQLIRAIHKNRDDLEILQTHYNQLRDYYPRFEKIMTRSGLLDAVVGFAAGFFGGDFGVAGAELWDDWRGRSDTEFVEIFANAVDEFSTAGLEFTQRMEAQTEPAIMQIAADVKEYYGTMLGYFRQFVLSGWDLEPFYRQFRAVGEPLDEDARQGIEFVLDNLREQGMSTRSERNLRTLLFGPD